MYKMLNTLFKVSGASCLLLLAGPVFSCDWKVNKTTDPMTDEVTCWVSSSSAKVSFYRHGKDRPNVYNKSTYSDSWLMIRIDDHKAISMGENAYTRQKALDELLPQLRTGKRIRTTFNDYPDRQDGDAQICNLQALLDACNT